MNKKGFTLVEMLVVIAIIAVLVAIIVPTAVGATKKAAAATDAANLRSVLAQINTWYLTDGTTSLTAGTAWDGADFTEGSVITIGTANTGIKAPACKTDKNLKFKISFNGTEFVVTFGTKTINDFSKIADGTSAS